MTSKEVNKIKNGCNFHLHGHYPKTPKQYFTEMNNYISSNEETDRYGKGTALKDFEKSISDLLGHEDCVFFQSGTMAQLIAMRIWSDDKKNKLIAFHPTCHLELHEHSSYRVLHRLNSEFIGEKNRLFNLKDLKNLTNKPAAVLFELPQREIGGQLPSWESLNEQIEYLRSKEVVVHLDGARLWECSSFYNKTYSEIASLFDSVYVSFYKGIGAISGAALLGQKAFIEKARVWNRRHGGNLVTASPVYLSARYNMKKRVNCFESYYKKTLEISSLINTIEGLSLIPNVPQVNMFHLIIKGEQKTLFDQALKISNEMKVWGFSHIKSAEKKGYCKLEWYVGDATLDVPIDMIEAFLRKMLI